MMRTTPLVVVWLAAILVAGPAVAQVDDPLPVLPVPDMAPPGDPQPASAPATEPAPEPDAAPGAEPAFSPAGEPEPEPVFEPMDEPTEPAPVIEPGAGPGAEPPSGEEATEGPEPGVEAPPETLEARESPAPEPEPVGWRATGGRLIKQGDDAIRAWVGFPGIGFAFQTPLSRYVEIAPKVGVFYGASPGPDVPVVGLDGGGELKLRLYLGERLAMALQVELLARLVFHSDFGFGMRYGVRLVGSYDATPDISVLFRVGLPIEMSYYPSFLFVLPIDFGGGVEASLTPDVNLYALVGLGPAVLASRGGSAVDLWLSGEVGVAYRF